MTSTRDTNDPWEPLARAMADHLDGDLDATAEVLMEDGRAEPFPAATLFRADGFPIAEDMALDLASGRILDVGAGAGPHALELQNQDLEVVALDISATAVDVMRRRGVHDARQGDIFTLREESFDTVLLLMNGLGMAGDLDGARRLLVHLHTLLRPDGAILVDSSDLRRTDEPRELRLIEKRRAAGRYFGEVQMQLRYRGATGAVFPWLFIDHTTLVKVAAPLGWHVQILFDDPDGPYLARLKPQ